MSDRSKPRRDNVCGVVVTYHPDNGLADRLCLLKQQVRAIVIVDNTPGVVSPIIVDTAVLASGYPLIRYSENIGVAAALNRGAEWAQRSGYDWILTVDQDSTAHAELSTSLREAWNAFEPKSRVAVIGVEYCSTAERNTIPQCPFKVVKAVITSGSLVRLDVWQQIGGFAEELFIDCVDSEYCLRARRHGYVIIQATKYGLTHDIGAPQQFKLLWRRPSVTHHSPLRRYYLTRNRLVVGFRYLHREPMWVAWIFQRSVKEWTKLFLFEHQRRLKLYATFLGILHFLTSRLGRLSDRYLSE